jgi:D-alanine-D-alanine ligase
VWRGVLASSPAIKKDVAKVLLRTADVPVPEGQVVSRFEAAKEHAMERPYVLK